MSICTLACLVPALLLAPADEIDDIRASVLGAGDLDADGLPDLVLASREGCEANPELPSTLWALSGCDGRPIFKVPAPHGDPEFGRALAAAGDLNRDGFLDVLVAGHSRVYALTSLDAGTLFALTSPDPSHDTFGHAIAGGYDLNADGFPDIAASVASLRSRETAPVYVFAGPAGEVLGCLGPDPLLTSGVGGWRQSYGQGLALLPDMDGDGGGEIAIAVQRGVKASKENEDPPRGYVDVRTAEGTLIQRLTEPDGEPARTGLFNGWNLSVAGDVDGDGRMDLAVASPSYFVSVHSVVDGSTLLACDYTHGYMHSEGTSLAPVGDLNGDGRDDLLVAANETGLDCDGGNAFIMSGADATVLHSYEPGWSADARCGLGVDAAAIGDVDSDGFTDIAVHVPRADRIETLSGNGLRPIFQRSLTTLGR